MRERPILFSGPMVRAILEGRKTQTRRVVKQKRSVASGLERLVRGERSADVYGPCPYGAPGDRLWVRETWGLHSYVDETEWHTSSVVGATDAILGHWRVAYSSDWGPNREGHYWRPSIYMPRWASRLTLEVLGVRVERLQDIGEEDAKAEGVEVLEDDPFEWDHRRQFQALWDSINGGRPWRCWDDNPWVWVVEFKQVSP